MAIDDRKSASDSPDPPPLKVALFCAGTTSSNLPKNVALQDKGLLHRGLVHLAHPLMYNENNSVSQLFANCALPPDQKHYFSGPGTDVLTETKGGYGHGLLRAANSIMGATMGDRGTHGVLGNVEKAKKLILDHIRAEKAAGRNGSLDLYLTGWSRGGITVEILEKELIKLKANNEIDPDATIRIFVHEFDPVSGSPIDRMTLAARIGKPQSDVEVKTTTYISDTGNIDIYDKTPLRNFANLPFFSGFVNSESTNYMVRGANHEDLVRHSKLSKEELDRNLGMSVSEAIRSPHVLEKLRKEAVGDATLANMVLEQGEQGLPYKETWRSKVIEEGMDALDILEQYGVLPSAPITRKFLTPESTMTPRPFKEVEAHVQTFDKANTPLRDEYNNLLSATDLSLLEKDLKELQKESKALQNKENATLLDVKNYIILQNQIIKIKNHLWESHYKALNSLINKNDETISLEDLKKDSQECRELFAKLKELKPEHDYANLDANIKEFEWKNIRRELNIILVNPEITTPPKIRAAFDQCNILFEKLEELKPQDASYPTLKNKIGGLEFCLHDKNEVKNLPLQELESFRKEIGKIIVDNQNNKNFMQSLEQLDNILFQKRLQNIENEIKEAKFNLRGGIGVSLAASGIDKRVSKGAADVFKYIKKLNLGDKTLSAMRRQEIIKELRDMIEGKTQIKSITFFGVGQRDLTTIDLYKRILTILEGNFEPKEPTLVQSNQIKPHSSFN